MIKFNVFSGEMSDAWEAYTGKFGTDERLEESIDVQRMKFWQKAWEDYGIRDVPDGPCITFECEETAMYFRLKFGTSASVDNL